MSLDPEVVIKAGRAAMEAARGAKKIGSVGGCGRVYVVLPENVRRGSKVHKAFESVGLRLMLRPYYKGLRNIYIGYDVATGLEWNQGEIIAVKLTEFGIKCYVDGDGD